MAGDNSDRSFLMKTLAVLVIITFISTGLMPGQNPGFNALMNTLENGFPTFDNPFNVRTSVKMMSAADGFIPPSLVVNTNPSGIANCTPSVNPTSNWWGCVNTWDGANSYASTNVSEDQFDVNLTDPTGTDSAAAVVSLVVTVSCRVPVGHAVNEKVDIVFLNSTGSPFEFLQYLTCYTGSFANQTIQQDFVASAPAPRPNVGLFVHAVLRFQGESPGDPTVDFSAVVVNMFYTAPDCNPADTLGYIGCIIAQGLATGIKGIQFLFNGAIFLGLLIVWGGTVIVEFVAGIVLASAALLTMPGEPALASGIIGLFLLVLWGGLIFAIITLVRGNE